MNTKQNEKIIMSLINLADGRKSAVVDEKTPLIMLIEDKMEQEALALIATGRSQPTYLDKSYHTALWYAMIYELEKVAFALIATGKLELFQPNNYGRTALMDACCDKRFEKVALALISNGKSKPEFASKAGNTALIFACYHKNETVALALLDTGKSNYQAKDCDGKDALFYANRNNLTKVVEKIESLMKPATDTQTTASQTTASQTTASQTTASQTTTPTQKDYEKLSLQLIKFIDSNTDDPTPLIWLLKGRLPQVALTLIATGQGQIEKRTRYGNTALQLACIENYESVVFALIATGKSMPENVNEDGKTALIIACFSYREKLALALLETGKSNYQQIDRRGNNALYYAKYNCLITVVAKIESLISSASTSSESTSSASTSSYKMISQNIFCRPYSS